MIEERLVGSGSFEFSLQTETPFQIIDVCNLETAAFAHVVVTPTRIDHRAVDVTGLLTAARYVGVYRRRSGDGLRLSGAGLSIWLGDEDDKGILTEVPVNSTKSFTDWVNAIVNVGGTYQLGNGLDVTPSSIEAIAGSYRLRHVTGVTARTLLDSVCLKAGAEWYVDTTGVVWVGTPGWLWPSTADPRVVVSRHGGSRDVNICGLHATGFDADEDVEDFSTDVHVHWVDDTEVWIESTSRPWDRFDGDDALWARAIDATEIADALNVEQIGQRELAKTDEIRRQLNLSVDAYDIGADVVPGDTIYVYDERAGYVGATQLPYRGEILFPVEKRVYATTWPVQQGMGVYLLVGGTSGEVTDLTDWVAFEDGDTTIEVGAPRRTLLRQRRRGEAA